MLLIIFLGLITVFASVSGDCDFGTHTMNDFDWNQVGISILTCLV